MPVDTVTAACGRVTDQPDLQDEVAVQARTLPPPSVCASKDVNVAEPARYVCVCVQDE